MARRRRREEALADFVARLGEPEVRLSLGGGEPYLVTGLALVLVALYARGVAGEPRAAWCLAGLALVSLVAGAALEDSVVLDSGRRTVGRSRSLFGLGTNAALGCFDDFTAVAVDGRRSGRRGRWIYAPVLVRADGERVRLAGEGTASVHGANAKAQALAARLGTAFVPGRAMDGAGVGGGAS